ncbi:MAG: hypothetical protein WC344_02630 [Bacilli bacterium]|jgi:vacuolar-type H+-ATPase subunit E/Vma4
MTLYEKIAKKGQLESDAIRKEAEIEAKALEHKIVAEAEREAALIIAKAEDAKHSAIAQAQALGELEKRQSFSALKSSVIDEVFTNVSEHFKTLEGEDLQSFVASQIKREKIDGDETMRVNHRDYEKYRQALSSSKEGKLIELDHLNKLLGKGYALKLENVPSMEEDGFLLIGATYDLNFSVKPLLDRMRKANEKTLFDRLFRNEE